MIHHVYANQENIGDWLSARGIQSLLAPLPLTEHFCDQPFVAATLERLAGLGSADLIVIGGGGLFMDYFAPFWEGLQQLRPAAPLCIWGVGYCDLKAEPSRPPLALLQSVARGARLCVVRDELTRRLLAIPGLPAPVACPSLAAIEPAPEGGWGVLHVDNYTTAGAAAAEAIDRLAAAYARDSDRPYRHTNHRVEQRGEAGLTHLLRQYAQSDLVISTALHGCIIATALGRPVLAVSGDRKIEAFMQAAGLGEWVLEVSELDRVPELLRRLPDQRVPRDFLAAEAGKNRAVAQQVRAIAAAGGS